MIHLINMCNKFVALSALMDKIRDPKARIDPDDLHCFDFKEFGTIPADEGLFWALRNLADEAYELILKPPGSRWHEYEEERKIDKKLDDLAAEIKRLFGSFNPS